MAGSEGPSTPPPKKPKRQCHFDEKWIEEFRGIGKSHRGNFQQCMKYNSLMTIIIGNTFAHCSLCSLTLAFPMGGEMILPPMSRENITEKWMLLLQPLNL